MISADQNAEIVDGTSSLCIAAGKGRLEMVQE